VRFLADESCDFAVVRAMRASGHDVVAITEQSPGTPDRDVIDLARRDDRILLTEDKDFGQLVFAALAGAAGVILIRYPAVARANLATKVVWLAENLGDRLKAAFVTLFPGRVRVSHLPPSGAD